MYTDYGDYMKLRYQNKDIELIECKSFFSRFKGFMMCKNINHALLFGNCNSIHTFFMISNIDVILCNDDNVILYYYKDLAPNKVILPKRGVTKVFELPVNYFDIKINDKLEVER